MDCHAAALVARESAFASPWPAVYWVSRQHRSPPEQRSHRLFTPAAPTPRATWAACWGLGKVCG